ncbi:MAG: hypothetical protein PUE12_06360 [Oscillospiraceae bacterium]|nr:hypothetical protein [Oscillospiraceae bacterium]
MADKPLSKLDSDCESIRRNLKDFGKLYLLIAYKIYELKHYKTYYPKYKNIAECCEKEFQIKKSSTYNLLKIVETFGEKDDSGMVTYKSICCYEFYSYKQLLTMVGLSEDKRKDVTPDTSVSEIKKLVETNKIKESEKFQPVGKSDVIETTFEDVPSDLVSSSEDVPSVPASVYSPNEIIDYVFSLVPPVDGLSYNDQLENAVMKQRSIISSLESDIYNYQENIATLNKRITELQKQLQMQ